MRKTIIALALAAAALGAAVSPSEAHWAGGPHWVGPHWGGPHFSYGYGYAYHPVYAAYCGFVPGHYHFGYWVPPHRVCN